MSWSMDSIALSPTLKPPSVESNHLNSASHATTPNPPPKQLIALVSWVSRSKPRHISFEDYFTLLRKNLRPKCAIEERDLDEFNFIKDSCVTLSKENRELKAKIARLEGRFAFADEANTVPGSVTKPSQERETIENENNRDDSDLTAGYPNSQTTNNLSLVIKIRQLEQYMKDSPPPEDLAKTLEDTLRRIGRVFQQDLDHLAKAVLDHHQMWVVTASFRESLKAYKHLAEHPDAEQISRVGLEYSYFNLFSAFLKSISTVSKKGGAENLTLRSRLSSTLVALLTCEEIRSWENNLMEMVLYLFIQRLGMSLGVVINWTGRMNKLFASKDLGYIISNSNDSCRHQASINQGLQLVYIIDRVLAGKTVTGMDIADARLAEKSWYQLQKVLVEAIWGKDKTFLERFKKYVPSKDDAEPLSTNINEPTDIEVLIAAASDVVGWEFLGHDFSG